MPKWNVDISVNTRETIVIEATTMEEVEDIVERAASNGTIDELLPTIDAGDVWINDIVEVKP